MTLAGNAVIALTRIINLGRNKNNLSCFVASNTIFYQAF
jgi:hypothetical protein